MPPPATVDTPHGGITVLTGDGLGGLTLQPEYYEVGAEPTDSVIADFNADGRPDLAVANSSSYSMSILLGRADGRLFVQPLALDTGSGAFDLAVADIDNDGDTDLIASNSQARNFSIFRNSGIDPNSGEVLFQPLESVSAGPFERSQRMPLVVGNFDNDRLGPAGSGTIDLVAAPQQTRTLHVLTNQLVDGAYRVALTGTNQIDGLDFIVAPAVVRPSFDRIVNPPPVDEDEGNLEVLLTGIDKGRDDGPSLVFTATSSHSDLIPDPIVNHLGGDDSATLILTPHPDASTLVNGPVTITVQARNAGANLTLYDDDDGIFLRDFYVNIRAVNDPPTFEIPAGLRVTQQDGPQSIDAFVTAIGPGGAADEGSQLLEPFVVNADPDLFDVAPAIDPLGRLTFTPSVDKSGLAQVTVTLADSGGESNGGIDTTTETFVLEIAPVNDPPTFALAGDVSVRADAGSQLIPGFAFGFDPGGGSDESSQVVSGYDLTIDQPGLFAVLPEIDLDGSLTFVPRGRSRRPGQHHGDGTR